MVHIVRNDATPVQRVNLVSDEDNPSSDSASDSASSSSRSSSGSGSSSSDAEAASSPSSLSNFIEEDNGPQLLPKPAAPTWKPLKPRRKPIRTLRRRPRLSRVDADEEKLTSTSSTSSDGVPTPDFGVDADSEADKEQEEEGYDNEKQKEGEEGRSSAFTPRSPRRCPRRSVAPRSFHDALRKYVEPMSNDALQYTRRTIGEFWNNDREFEESEESKQDSDDSSIAYVSVQQPQMMEERLALNERRANKKAARRNRKRTTQRVRTYHADSSPVIPSDREEVGASDHVRPQAVCKASMRRSLNSKPVERRFLMDWSDSEDDEPLAEKIDRMRAERNKRLTAEPILPQRTCLKPQNSSVTSRRPSREIECIDLCSDEEYPFPATQLEADESSAQNTSYFTPSNEDTHNNYCETDAQEQSMGVDDIEIEGGEIYVSPPITPTPSTAEGLIVSQEQGSCLETECVEDVPPLMCINRSEAHVRNAHKAATLPHSQSPLKQGADDSNNLPQIQNEMAMKGASKQKRVVKRRTTQQLQTKEPPVIDPQVKELQTKKPQVKEPQVIEPQVIEPQVKEPQVIEPQVTEPQVTEPQVTEPQVTEPQVTEPQVTEPQVTEPQVTANMPDSSGFITKQRVKPEEKRTQSGHRAPLGTTDHDSKAMPQGFNAIPRFWGAKQRGTLMHPDVRKDRVPKSKAEKRAWLKFIKDELRDIYRTFKNSRKTQKYICANVDLKFPRQIVGQVGKLMGLEVDSEEDGDGRKLILRRPATGLVLGPESAVLKAAESFFRDAMRDLLSACKENNKTNKRKHPDSIIGSKENGGLNGTPPSKKQRSCHRGFGNQANETREENR